MSLEDDISAARLVDNIVVVIKKRTFEKNCNRTVHFHKTIYKPSALYQRSNLHLINIISPIWLKNALLPRSPSNFIQTDKFLTWINIYPRDVLETKLLWHNQVLANKIKDLKSIEGIADLGKSV